jgi:hypothetical protein
MCEKFIKLNTTEERNHHGDWLAMNHPTAFILLYFIARRARRCNGYQDGLMSGDALISSTDFEPKISRQNFRTAINKLVKFGYVKIVSNGKKLFVDRKSTIKVTITGMIVNLCNTTIWDINSEDANQQSNQRPTNDQPTTNHKQERIRKKKNEKEEEQPPTPSSNSKIQFREHVSLTQVEYDSLKEKHGEIFVASMLDILDAYKGSNGKKYKSDFHTMKEGGWVVERTRKEKMQGNNANEKPQGFNSTRRPPGNNPEGGTKFHARVLRGENPDE